MRVMVTGATGFVGRHVVNQLLKCDYSVVAIARNRTKAQTMPWFDRVEFVQCDLYDNFRILLKMEYPPDAIIHLAWAGLPNYRDFFHISANLPADLEFLECAVRCWEPHLIVAGTCLEYGNQFGPLTEEMETKPSTPYGYAKDTLRKALEFLQKEHRFTLQWMRLFYMYGEGQNKNSLMAQLDREIDVGHSVFNMSKGDQLRDYLPIEKVAEYFVVALENPEYQGVFNCSSGTPISVLDLVQQRCREKESSIQLNRGFYPYPDYEPLAFWGVPTKLQNIRAALSNTSKNQ